VLYDIYKVYFAHELRSSADLAVVTKETQKSLNYFMKDFDICPGLIAKAAAFNMLVNDIKTTPIYEQTGLSIADKAVG
jgi:hypothetical protein